MVPVTPARAIAPTDLDGFLPQGPLLLAGDALDAALAALEAAGRDVLAAAAPAQADAGRVAALAVARPLPEVGAPPPDPIYLRGPDVTLAPPPGAEPGAAR